jgi:hypothetical protein
MGSQSCGPPVHGDVILFSIIMEELSLGNIGPTDEFERIGEENGGFWYARQFMDLMGYETYSSFQKAIGRAMQICSTLEFSIADHFPTVQREIDGVQFDDHKRKAQKGQQRATAHRFAQELSLYAAPFAARV